MTSRGEASACLISRLFVAVASLAFSRTINVRFRQASMKSTHLRNRYRTHHVCMPIKRVDQSPLNKVPLTLEQYRRMSIGERHRFLAEIRGQRSVEMAQMICWFIRSGAQSLRTAGPHIRSAIRKIKIRKTNGP
jgi:hypothetical protein